MKYIILFAVLLTTPLLLGTTVFVNTQGNYDTVNRVVRISATTTTTPQAIALNALTGNCSCGSFPATWYAEKLWSGSTTVSLNDQSAEPVTIIALTPSASINNSMYVVLTPRVGPDYKIHKDRWGNAFVFIVKNTCTPTHTCNPTVTPGCSN